MIPPSSYFPQKFNLADGPVNEIVTSKGAPSPQVGMNGTDGFWVKNAAGAYVFHAAIDGSLTIAGPLNTTIAAGNIVGQLADSQLAAIGAAKVTGQLTDSQLVAIAAAKITGQLTDSQLSAIAAGKITGLITSGQLSIAQLDQIATNLGTITSGILRGLIFETQAANPKVRHDATGFFVTDAGGVQLVTINTVGGISLLTAGAAPVRVQSYNWTRSNGTQSGYVGNGEAGSPVTTATILEASAKGAGDKSRVRLLADDSAGTTQTQLQITQDSVADATNSVVVALKNAARTVGYNKTLIDGAGNSDYATYGPWTAFPYNAANFQDAGGTDQVVEYRVSGNGDIDLRGVAASKAGVTVTLTTTQIGLLPVGARPAKDIQFPMYIFDSNGIGGTMGQVQIGANGTIIVWRDLTGRAQTRTSPYYVTFNGIRFSTLA